MAYCKECRFFFPIPEVADDYELGKGDCVLEEKDDKGKYWSSHPIMGDTNASKCEKYTKRIGG
ncbi:MAG: benzylsuccinate synthase subunit gamma [Firmicutes bacterium HGW-Firmicutes-12]|nr:MAG: benzylsuccinate synthase subunit gamma [Firmicutes bacterium HGW-Firmicutes-12]